MRYHETTQAGAYRLFVGEETYPRVLFAMQADSAESDAKEIPAAEIPVATSSDGKVKVRVIAGRALGKSALIETRTPIYYLHFTIQPGGELVQEIPAGPKWRRESFVTTAMNAMKSLAQARFPPASIR